MSLNQIEATFHTFGIERKDPKEVQVALKDRDTLTAYLAEPQDNAAELAATGHIAAAIDAVTAATAREAILYNGSRERADKAVARAVNANVETYLKQLAPTVQGYAEDLAQVASTFPVGAKNWSDLSAAVRGRWANELGQALDIAADLIAYGNLVSLLAADKTTRSLAATAALIDIPPTPIQVVAHPLESVNILADLSRGAGAEDLIKVAAGGYTPLSLKPSANLDELDKRMRGWEASLYHQPANA